VRLGVDPGEVRIGVAVCDPAGVLASPVETVRRGRGDVDRLATLAADYGAVEVVVGLPVSMSGAQGPSAAKARAFAQTLADLLGARSTGVRVRLVDERLSTVSASRGLRERGVRGRRERSVVDQAAAVVILQSALDAERSQGRPPGETVEPTDQVER
jgi:putative Holliday junction resolvase